MCVSKKQSSVASFYTQGDSDIVSFHIYASWFSPCGIFVAVVKGLRSERGLEFCRRLYAGELPSSQSVYRDLGELRHHTRRLKRLRRELDLVGWRRKLS